MTPFFFAWLALRCPRLMQFLGLLIVLAVVYACTR